MQDIYFFFIFYEKQPKRTINMFLDFVNVDPLFTIDKNKTIQIKTVRSVRKFTNY